MKKVFVVGFLFSSILLSGQLTSIDDHLLTKTTGNNLHKKISGDAHSSAYVVTIVKELHSHAHEEQFEYILVLEGSGVFQHSNVTAILEPGDLLFVPKGEPHSVKVTQPKPVVFLSIRGSSTKDLKHVALLKKHAEELVDY